MPRLFIAVTVPPTARIVDALAAMAGGAVLRVPGVRALVHLKPVRPQCMHLTLRFLGETPEARVREVTAAVDRAVGRSGVGPFTMRFHGLETFGAGRSRPPRVVFAPLVDAGPLQRIESALSEELASLSPSIPREVRPYRPHLTLARVSEARAAGEPEAELASLLDRWRETAWGEAAVEAVELIESRLSPKGATYTTRHRALLTA